MNQHRKIFILLSFLFLSLIVGSGFQPGHASAEEPQPARFQSRVKITVDIAKTHQVMQGFGAVTLPLVYGQGNDVLGSELRLQAIDILSRKIKINLNILGGGLLESPGDYSQRANDDQNPFTINKAGFNTELADAIKSRYLDLTPKPDPVTYLLLQRINTRWDSPWLSALRNTDYDRYLDESAEQIVAGASYWRDVLGVTPPYLVPFNEPVSGNTELESRDPKQLADIIARAGARLEAAGFRNVRMVAPNEEMVGSSISSAAEILKNPQARKYLAAIGYHPYPYGSNYVSIPKILATSGAGKPDEKELQKRQELRQLSQQYKIPVWLTEISNGGVEPLSYDAFLGRAIHIHDELIYADASAYFAMHTIWDSVSHKMHFNASDLLGSRSEGNILLVDVPKKVIYITGMGYAIGHYSRWIRPGMVRVEAASNDALVQVSAFYDQSHRRLILVLINNAPQARLIEVDLGGLRPSGLISGEQSTPGAYWKPLAAIPRNQGDPLSVSLPPKSVTSFAFTTSR